MAYDVRQLIAQYHVGLQFEIGLCLLIITTGSKIESLRRVQMGLSKLRMGRMW